MRVKPFPLVAAMWFVTGAGIAWEVFGSAPAGHPTASPGDVVMLQMLWMTILVAVVFLRVTVAPAEVDSARRLDGECAAIQKAQSIRDAISYLLGLMPLVALIGLSVTGWANGAAVVWLVSLGCMLALAPDATSFERSASRA